MRYKVKMYWKIREEVENFEKFILKYFLIPQKTVI